MNNKELYGDWGTVKHSDGRVGLYDDDTFDDDTGKERAIVYFPNLFIGREIQPYELVDYSELTKIEDKGIEG